jgi:hypothetical protein
MERMRNLFLTRPSGKVNKITCQVLFYRSRWPVVFFEKATTFPSSLLVYTFINFVSESERWSHAPLQLQKWQSTQRFEAAFERPGGATVHRCRGRARAPICRRYLSAQCRPTQEGQVRGMDTCSRRSSPKLVVLIPMGLRARPSK